MAATRKSPKTVKKKSPAKVIPGTIRKITPLRKTKTPTLKTGFRRTTPGRTTPGRTTSATRLVTPKRVTRKGSPKSLSSLKPRTPVKKTGISVASKLSPSRQFLYISLSICAGLVLFFLILFACYKIYEYFNPSEKTTTDTIDFMEELEDIEEKGEEKVTEEVPEEEKVTEEKTEE